MGATRPSLTAAAALVCAALSSWVSFGAIGFLEADNDAAYVGLLPSFALLALLLAGAAAAAWIGRPSARSVAPLWLSGVALLPWLPLPLPLSVFVWTGNALIWLWGAIGCALAIPLLGRAVSARRLDTLSPRQAATMAGLLALAVYGLGAWAVAPSHPNGDEPHYLIITQSILQDRDLKIENNHRQHDYQAYIDRAIPPDFLKRGTDGEIYSIHAPGLPLLVAPFFLLFGYPGVVSALAVLGALGSAAAWLFAWRTSGSRGAAWFAWAAVSLAVPYFFHATSVFPDGVAAVLLLLALLPLASGAPTSTRTLLVAGGALATLPWLHSRFAVLAAAAGVVLAGRLLSAPADRLRRLMALFALPAVSAAVWFLFFQMIYGTPNPSVVYGGNTNTEAANLVRGVPGLLFDQQFGLFSNAPVLLCAIGGAFMMLRREQTRLAAELAIVIVPYFVVVGFFFMWWAGTTPPARFLVPVVPLLAAPVAVWYARSGRTARAAGLAALLASLQVTATMALVDRGAFVFNFRDGMSRVALWLTPVVDVTRALPSLFQNPPAIVVGQTAIWVGAIAMATLAAFMLRDRYRLPTALAVGLPLQLAIMTAVSIVWRVNGTAVPRPFAAAPTILRELDGDSAQVAVGYRPFRRLDQAELLSRVVLARVLDGSDSPGSASMSGLPPGTYEVRGTTSGSAAGRVLVRTDRVSGPIASWDAATLGSTWTRTLTLPIGVAGLQVEVEPAARAAIRDLTVRAAAVADPDPRFAGLEARRGARYGRALMFLLAGDAWVEPVGTWVAAESGAEFVIAPDAESPPQLFVRNGPVVNQVHLESEGWRASLTLSPGEERLLPLPSGAALMPLKVTAEKGFRPVEVDPKSQDQRYLGVWIETR